LLFENYSQEVGGDQYLKFGGPVSHGPYGCCAYGLSTANATNSDLVLVYKYVYR